MSSTPPTPKSVHTRVSSADERRVSVPRRRTKGPLDLGDPPFKPHPQSPPPPPQSPPSTSPTTTTKDLTHLLHPQNFHPLPQHPIPAPFRTTNPPPPTTPLPALLSTRHFRSAAIAASNILTNPHPTPPPPEEIFKLWYIRLASLSLTGMTATAAQEVKAFGDLSLTNYRDGKGGHLLPWEMRVLAVRLQAVGGSDWRRCLPVYYELAREARGRVAVGGFEVELWRDRLRDLGVRVAGALVEMGDLKAAVGHLEGVRRGGGGGGCRGQVGVMLCLLYIRVGNLAAAKGCLVDCGGVGGQVEKVLEALVAMGEGRWGDSAALWREIDGAGGQGGHVARNNLAVCLLYMGDLKEARAVLEALVEDGTAFHGLTFNLSTMYELCSDNSKALKLGLAERVAAQGKEMIGSSFKM